MIRAVIVLFLTFVVLQVAVHRPTFHPHREKWINRVPPTPLHIRPITPSCVWMETDGVAKDHCS